MEHHKSVLDAFIASIRKDDGSCPACGGGIVLPHQTYCSDCEKLKRERDEYERARRRGQYFGFNPWRIRP
jgi:hypothetical protein